MNAWTMTENMVSFSEWLASCYQGNAISFLLPRQLPAAEHPVYGDPLFRNLPLLAVLNCSRNRCLSAIVTNSIFTPVILLSLFSFFSLEVTGVAAPLLFRLRMALPSTADSKFTFRPLIFTHFSPSSFTSTLVYGPPRRNAK